MTFKCESLEHWNSSELRRFVYERNNDIRKLKASGSARNYLLDLILITIHRLLLIIFHKSSSERLRRRRESNPDVWGVYGSDPLFMNASYVPWIKVSQTIEDSIDCVRWRTKENPNLNSVENLIFNIHSSAFCWRLHGYELRLLPIIHY